MRFTNRNLQKAFGLTLNHLKKWAVLALGRDPEADQAGGVRRTYSLDDAFLIYLFGKVLVQRFHIKLNEAKIHLNNIAPVLKAEGLLPSKIDPHNETLNYFPIEIINKAKKHKNFNSNRLQAIELTILPGYYYLIEWSIFIFEGKFNNKDRFIAYIERKNFPEENFINAASKEGAQFYIPILIYIMDFNSLISKIS